MDLINKVIELHNSTPGFSVEVFCASWLIYRRVTKKLGLNFQKLLSAMDLQSGTLTEHTKKFGEVEHKIEKNEKRIGVLETDVGKLKTLP